MPNPIPDMHILMLWHFNAICRQEAQPAVLSELGPRTIFLLPIINSSSEYRGIASPLPRVMV